MIEEIFKVLNPVEMESGITPDISALCICGCKCRVSDPTKDDTDEDYKGEGK